MRRPDLIHRLAALADQVPAVLPPERPLEQLRSLCDLARAALGAAAVSIAVVEGAMLRYVAASGAGAEVIVGTEVPTSRGLGGYVALTGQALAVDRPAEDRRFARDVAERTGLVPGSMLVVPVSTSAGDVIGVVSVLDRSTGPVAAGDPLGLASSVARHAALVLPVLTGHHRAGDLLLGAVVDAAATGDADIAAALRRSLATRADVDESTARLLAVVASVASLDEDVRDRLAQVLEQVVELATPRRRR